MKNYPFGLGRGLNYPNIKILSCVEKVYIALDYRPFINVRSIFKMIDL
jgi:hypothetical protein